MIGGLESVEDKDIEDAGYDLAHLVAYIFPIIEADKSLGGNARGWTVSRLSRSLRLGSHAMFEEFKKRTVK